MTILLIILSGYIAVNLICGNGPRWTAITLYWVAVYIKNFVDGWRRLNDND